MVFFLFHALKILGRVAIIKLNDKNTAGLLCRIFCDSYRNGIFPGDAEFRAKKCPMLCAYGILRACRGICGLFKFLKRKTGI